jgi:hypothetical protein
MYRKPNNSGSRWIWLTILTIGVFFFATIRSGHAWGDDFAMYIRHAINLSNGTPYDETGVIRNPWNFLGPVAYPPVFPLLLAPVYKLWGVRLTVMKVEIILFFLLSLWMIYLSLKNEIEWPYLVAALALIGFNPWVWEFKDQILSDIPCIFFTYLSLYLIRKACDSNRAAGPQIGYGVLTGVSIYLSYGTRTIGAALLLALVVYDLLKHRRPSMYLISTVVMALALIYLQKIAIHHETAAGYVEPMIAQEESLAFRLRMMADHSGQLIRAFAEYLQNGYSTLFRWAMLVSVLAAAGAGYFIRSRKISRVSVFEIFLPLYLAPLITLPIDIEARYLLPMVPLVLFYLFVGLQAFSRRFGIETTAFAAAIGLFLATYLGQYSRLDLKSLPQGVGKIESQQLFEYIKRETSEKDILLFRKPRALSLLTGRTGAVWYRESKDGKLWDYFSTINATYLITGPAEVEPEDQEFIRRFVERNRPRLHETFANADFHVYRLDREISTR